MIISDDDRSPDSRAANSGSLGGSGATFGSAHFALFNVEWPCVECSYSNSATNAQCAICREPRPVLDGLLSNAMNNFLIKNRAGVGMTLGHPGTSTSHVYFCLGTCHSNMQCKECVGYSIFSASALKDAPLNKTVNSSTAQQLVDCPGFCPKSHLLRPEEAYRQLCELQTGAQEYHVRLH